MPRNAHQIDVHFIDVQRDLANSLRGVCVEVNTPVLPDDGSNFLQRLDYTSLVVDGHDADERGVRPNGLLELFQTDDSVLLDRKVGHVEPFLAQFSTGVKNAFVLLQAVKQLILQRRKEAHRLNCDDMLFLFLVETGNTFNGHVVRLRCTRGKNDVLWLSADEACNILYRRQLNIDFRIARRTFRASSTALSASQP